MAKVTITIEDEEDSLDIEINFLGTTENTPAVLFAKVLYRMSRNDALVEMTRVTSNSINGIPYKAGE
jgi:hypothetical protein